MTKGKKLEACSHFFSPRIVIIFQDLKMGKKLGARTSFKS
jgi:hypothetical protein